MAVYQVRKTWLTHRYRGQAPSHIWIATTRNSSSCQKIISGYINILK